MGPNPPTSRPPTGLRSDHVEVTLESYFEAYATDNNDKPAELPHPDYAKYCPERYARYCAQNNLNPGVLSDKQVLDSLHTGATTDVETPKSVLEQDMTSVQTKQTSLTVIKPRASFTQKPRGLLSPKGLALFKKEMPASPEIGCENAPPVAMPKNLKKQQNKHAIHFKATKKWSKMLEKIRFLKKHTECYVQRVSICDTSECPLKVRKVHRLSASRTFCRIYALRVGCKTVSLDLVNLNLDETDLLGVPINTLKSAFLPQENEKAGKNRLGEKPSGIKANQLCSHFDESKTLVAEEQTKPEPKVASGITVYTVKGVPHYKFPNAWPLDVYVPTRRKRDADQTADCLPKKRVKSSELRLSEVEMEDLEVTSEVKTKIEVEVDAEAEIKKEAEIEAKADIEANIEEIKMEEVEVQEVKVKDPVIPNSLPVKSTPSIPVSHGKNTIVEIEEIVPEVSTSERVNSKALVLFTGRKLQPEKNEEVFSQQIQIEQVAPQQITPQINIKCVSANASVCKINQRANYKLEGILWIMVEKNFSMGAWINFTYEFECLSDEYINLRKSKKEGHLQSHKQLRRYALVIQLCTQVLNMKPLTAKELREEVVGSSMKSKKKKSIPKASPGSKALAISSRKPDRVEPPDKKVSPTPKIWQWQLNQTSSSAKPVDDWPPKRKKRDWNYDSEFFFDCDNYFETEFDIEYFYGDNNDLDYDFNRGIEDITAYYFDLDYYYGEDSLGR